MNVLQRFYFLRAGVAFVWVALVVLLSRSHIPPLITGALLVLYPLWDAGANMLDAQHSGGLGVNREQRVNAAISVAAAIILVIALTIRGAAGGLLVFGLWALLAGLLQLLVGIRRWKLGGQVFMIISGGQSVLAGVFMAIQALGKAPSIAHLAPYAAFGGFYFLLAGLRLTFQRAVPQPLASGG